MILSDFPVARYRMEVSSMSQTELKRSRPFKKIIGRKALIHAVATCEVCGKNWDDFETAKKLAAKHVTETGHRVYVETGYVTWIEATRGEVI